MPKLKLSLEEQIDHMKTQKGILFGIVSEEAAKSFLANHNYYFRVKAYAKNYDKYIAGSNQGKYINLEFAYLQELSILDMHLRNIILKMTIDIEHFLKTKLMRDFTANDNEDGYSIVVEFLKANSRIKESFDTQKNGAFCWDLIEKYRGGFAIWNIIEVLSFGEFIQLYNLYYEKYPSKDSMRGLLWSARILRNAAAHNNCLLISLKRPSVRKVKSTHDVNHFISQIPGVNQKTLTRKMSNPVVNDFIVTLHLFNSIVSGKDVRADTMKELRQLVRTRFLKNKHYFSKNQVLQSNYAFIRKIVDFYYKDSL